jgi:hypothetical protein
MKKKGVNGVLLSPAPEGWCIWTQVPSRKGWERGESCPDLASILERVPESAELVVALPENVVVAERMELPFGEPGEIAGMVELQLEKSLPYPIDDATFSFEVIRPGKNAENGVVFSVVAGTSQLEQLFEEGRVKGKVPARMVLYGQLVAAERQDREKELCVWKESAGICAGIAHRGRLEFLQGGMEAGAEFSEQLRRFLLAADLAGVGGDFDGVRLEAGLEEVESAVRLITGVESECMKAGEWHLERVSGDLVPGKWRTAQEQSRKTGDLKARIQMGAALYLLLVAGAFLFLAWTKYGVRQIDAQLLQIQPLVEEVNQRKAQWSALAPAVDPSMYTVEILYLVFRSLPNPEVKITVFEQKGGGFKVEGEAPSPIQWTEFMEKLRAEPGLANYRIEGPPPGVLSNGGARFSIFGKP